MASPAVIRLQQQIEAVRPALSPYVSRTPLEPLEFEGRDPPARGEWLLKCEHLQRTGSFKVRGALAKLIALGAVGRDRGVIAASSGNHGLGVAYALSVLGGSGIIFVPRNASTVKVAAITRLGAEVRHVGEVMSETEAAAREYAESIAAAYISPYNDLDVIAGQGSLGAEICDQLDGSPLHSIFVSVGGGGLAAGVAAAVKARYPQVTVYGASPANDAAMAASVGAGRIVEVDARPTLSDGTAGGIEAAAITFDLCRELVDEWVLVDEFSIRRALRAVIDTRHQLIEGAAAVAVAAALSRAAELDDQRVLVISCGANISADTLRSALS